MLLRPATLADIKPLVALIDLAYRGEGSRVGWTTEADLLDGQRTDADNVREAISNAESRVLVADEEGEIVGCCHIQRLHDGRAYFGMFAVRPNLQGRGRGRALVDEAERIARDEWRSSHMTMDVIKQRGELIAWYERLGYSATGGVKPFPYGQARFGITKRDDLEFVQLAKGLR